MKKILVPTDFSEQAGYAAEVAASIAKKNDAELHLLHIIDIPNYSDNPSFPVVPESGLIAKQAKERMEEAAGAPYFRDVKLTQVIEFDTTYQRIIEKVKEDDIDLIVIGSHGTSGIERFLIGSTTEKVIQFSPCLVLTIRERIEAFDIKSIVFASNFFNEASDGFNKVQEFVEIFGAKIHLLKVNTRHHFTTTRHNQQAIDTFIKNNTIKNFTINIYDDDSEEDGILHFSEDVNADMIALTTHGRTGLSHLINGSIAETLSEVSPKPLLTYKTKHPRIIK
ncbi:MAG: universal stress protein [Chlorobiales bacterium]|nr:universal stress protein [Chlorobiales bacterium]